MAVTYSNSTTTELPETTVYLTTNQNENSTSTSDMPKKDYNVTEGVNTVSPEIVTTPMPPHVNTKTTARKKKG